MKKTVLIFMFSMLFLGFVSKNACAISANCSCVIEVESGRVLHENNAYTRCGMASTTKIMTALVAIESGRLDEIAVVSNNAAYTEGSSLYLKSGEKLSVRDLVYGLMLNSGNDAAVVIAEHIGGSVDEFVKLMNQKAKSLNLNNTNFVNPNGLSDDMHYTTAHELAQLTAYALKNQFFSDIAATKSKVIETVDTKREIYLNNHNKLLGNLEGCDGVKTGFTKATGRCLVSSVTRNGFQTVCVTLNAPDDWNDHKFLYNQTFSQYNKITLLENGVNAGKVPVLQGEVSEVCGIVAKSVEGVYRIDSESKPDIHFTFEKGLIAPISKGEIIGVAKVFLDGEQVGTADVISDRDVQVAQNIKYMSMFLGLFRNVYQF